VLIRTVIWYISLFLKVVLKPSTSRDSTDRLEAHIQVMPSLKGEQANGWTDWLDTSSGKCFPLLIQHKNDLAVVLVWVTHEQNTTDLP